MYFLAVMFVLVLYVVVALTVIVKARNACTTPRAKNISTVLLLLTAVLVPTGDHVVGYWVFKQECAKIGDGVEIVRTVEGVEGFLDLSGIWREGARRHGYRYLESQERDRSYVRYQFRDDGAWEQVPISEPTSLYSYSARLGDQLQEGIRLTSQQITHRVTGEVLASTRALSYGGGWVARAMGGGQYGRCGTDMNLTDFVVGVLRPSRAPHR